MTDRLQDQDGAIATVQTLVDLAKAAGADVAQAGYSYDRQASVTYRDGEVVSLEQSEGLDLRLRVWIGDRVAALSGNQLDQASMKDLAEQAVERAKVLPATPLVTLPAVPDQPREAFDVEITSPALADVQVEAETLYRGVMGHDGVVNSDGGTAGFVRALSATAVSNGLAYASGYSQSYRQVGCEAGQGDARIRDYDYSSSVFAEDLKDVEAIATKAAERTLGRVGAQPVQSFEGDLVFEPRMAKSLIGGFLGAINGASIAKGASFLKDAMEQEVFGPSVEIWDDPTLQRTPGARRLDAEGHRPERLQLVEAGKLKTLLLDRRTAALLNLETNARAAGGAAISPSPTNVIVSGGVQNQSELIKGVKRGLFITDMMGQGLDPISGAYSRGAGGFLIEDGVLTQPIQAMTVAGDMATMLRTLILGSDIDRDGSLHVPSVLVPNMKVAGL